MIPSAHLRVPRATWGASYVKVSRRNVIDDHSLLIEHAHSSQANTGSLHKVRIKSDPYNGVYDGVRMR